MSRQAARLACAVIVMACALPSACALGPVTGSPEEEARRSAAMAADCARRGGVWDRQAKVCIGADRSGPR